MTSRAALALSSAVLLMLGGCKVIHHLTHDDACNKPQAYQRASSVAPLNIPQGLDTPDTSRALDIPPLNEPAPRALTPKDPCMYAPPSFDVPQTNGRPNGEIGEE